MPKFPYFPRRSIQRPTWPFKINQRSWESQGLVCWIPLGSTNNICDLAGGGAGQLRGPAGYIQSPIFGPAPRFPATTTRATVINRKPYNSGGSFGSLTISAWVYFEKLSGSVQQTIFHAPGAVGTTGIFLDAASRWDYTRAYVTNKIALANETPALQTWYHVVATDDESVTATQAHIYVNGVEVTYNTQTNGATVSGGTANWQIGTSAANNTPMLGAVTDIRMYNYQMTLDEVIDLRDRAPYWDLYSPPKSYMFVTSASTFLPRLTILGAG